MCFYRTEGPEHGKILFMNIELCVYQGRLLISEFVKKRRWTTCHSLSLPWVELIRFASVFQTNGTTLVMARGFLQGQVPRGGQWGCVERLMRRSPCVRTFWEGLGNLVSRIHDLKSDSSYFFCNLELFLKVSVVATHSINRFLLLQVNTTKCTTKCCLQRNPPTIALLINIL